MEKESLKSFSTEVILAGDSWKKESLESFSTGVTLE